MMKNTLGTSVVALAICALFALPLTGAFFAHPVAAQAEAMNSDMLQQKLAAIKTSAAENQRKLHQYTWTETQQVTLNGDPKPSKEFTCSYGPDGKVQKVQIGGASAEPESGGRGRLRQRIVAKKTAEMKDYMQQVGHVIALYMPPNPQKMQQAFQDRKVSMNRSEGMGNLEFRDYALPGDSMTISFDTGEKRIRSLTVHTYLDNPQDPVSLRVEFSRLPDDTNYPMRTTLDAQAKKITVVNTNTNYRKNGQ